MAQRASAADSETRRRQKVRKPAKASKGSSAKRFTLGARSEVRAPAFRAQAKIRPHAPRSDEIATHVAESTAALEHALESMKKPGVRPSLPMNVPKYSVDPDDPTIVVRRQGGFTRRGRLVGGEFVPGK